MYERLDKLRADLERAKQKRVELDGKIRQLEAKLKEAENNQILSDVSALKLTPEQLAQFLKLAAGGQLPVSRQEIPEYKLENEVEESEDEEHEE